MGKTEIGFALMLLVIVFAAIGMALFQDPGASGGASSAAAATITSDKEGEAVQLTGDRSIDTCTCFDQAYSYARAQFGLESVQYRGGFETCSQQLGRTGANAWTAGWKGGRGIDGQPRSCPAYVRTAR